MKMDSRLSSSAATNVPFDVLQEIFFYCLPDFPLDEAQPNTKIAPMLLCHVCSSWRTTALASPRLWRYLCYRLPLRWDISGKFGSPPIAWNPKIFLSAMECFKWWRQNQGSKAPFIRLECYQPKNTYAQSLEIYLTHDVIIQLFVQYLSSAQYLDITDFALYVPEDKPIDDSSSQVLYANLQSLAISYPKSEKWTPLTGFDIPLKPFSPFYTGAKFRRLRIHHVELVPDDSQAFAQWSGLTHISLHNMYMTPDVWYSFIRGVPNLQWGYFEIFLRGPSNEYPPSFTLPYLDTLSVTLDDSESSVEGDGEPFSQLLVNLHLPALRGLSVYIDADPWSFPIVAAKINDGLESAPAVTKLTLAFQFFGFTEFTEPDIDWDEVDKLPTLLPDLAHLVLDTCYMRAGFEYEATLSRRLEYWTQFLPPTRWLDLDSPASSLRKISVVVEEPSREGPSVEDAFRKALELEEAGHDEEMKVVLEIIPKDKWGLAPYAEGYKTWGCSL